MVYGEKKRALITYLSELAEKDLAVAFSGGVDSSLLLFLCCNAARQKGTQVTAVTVQTSLHPHEDAELARRVAEAAGAHFEKIQTDVLDEAGIRMNHEDRCYRCKRHLFGKLLERAAQLGAPHVLEGTNADDLQVYRPGLRALSELGILSPLAQMGVTKAEVRQLASEMGVPVAKRASMPCMATRFPYNTRLDTQLMGRLGEAEAWLRSQGFYNVRLRVHGDIVRLETDAKDFEKLLAVRQTVTERLKAIGLAYITLDLEGYRSGSMDIHIKERK